MVSGKPTAKHFENPSVKHKTEQKEIKKMIIQLQKLIDRGKQEQYDLQQFLKNVRKFTGSKELTAEILNDLVDKTVIHVPDKSSGRSKQKIKFYLRGCRYYQHCR